MSEVGIDDIAIHFPKLYLDMKDFAEMRDADYGKLNKDLLRIIHTMKKFTKYFMVDIILV